MRNAIVFLILSAVVNTAGYSQAPAVGSNQDTIHRDGEVFYIVDQQPEFPGGMSAFYKYIAKNIVYPKGLKKQKIGGRVFVEFVIDDTGAILQDSVRVVQELHPVLDQEAVRLIIESPQWIPGYSTSLGKHSPVRMILPITFGKK